MSVTVACFQTSQMPVDAPLAVVYENGDLSLWPEGVGVGPMIRMSVRDWEQLKRSADSAIRVRRAQLDRYTACEGHNGDGDE
jgi:hypothetical protein